MSEGFRGEKVLIREGTTSREGRRTNERTLIIIICESSEISLAGL